MTYHQHRHALTVTRYRKWCFFGPWLYRVHCMPLDDNRECRFQAIAGFHNRESAHTYVGQVLYHQQRLDSMEMP